MPAEREPEPSRTRFLVVEDDFVFAGLLRAELLAAVRPPAGGSARDEPDRRAAGPGLEIDVAASLATATERLAAGSYRGVFVDRRLPDGDGLSLLARAEALPGVTRREAAFVVVSADARPESREQALRLGAEGYLVKDQGVVHGAVRTLRRWLDDQSDGDRPRGADCPGRAATEAPHGSSATGGSPSARGIGRLIGRSAAMAELRARIRLLAASAAPVLIEGETGTGKELVARALHEEGPRARGPFVPVNCGAIAEHLAESELFGHARGSFTGALRDHVGLIEQADRGTLLLDEFEDLSASLQGKLLRFLQEAEIRPVGAARVRRVAVRVVAASNQNLAALVAERRLRLDLYHRVRVLSVRVPPLRERLEDLPELIAHLLVRRLGPAGKQMPADRDLRDLVERFRRRAWSGNVRELDALVERAVTLRRSAGAALDWAAALEDDEPPVMAAQPGEPSPDGAVSSASAWPGPADRWAVPTAAGDPPRVAGAEPSVVVPPGQSGGTSSDPDREFLVGQLARRRWRRAETARDLGISRVTLWRRMRRAGLIDGDSGNRGTPELQRDRDRDASPDRPGDLGGVPGQRDHLDPAVMRRGSRPIPPDEGE